MIRAKRPPDNRGRLVNCLIWLELLETPTTSVCGHTDSGRHPGRTGAGTGYCVVSVPLRLMF
jgi:hypothetical protein